ncbi:hypothetical protein WME90_03785 [Sorangium sp. So ce375]|uniref:hypothetical protein n=1 Tax=Sorangium sp. So ce375 TaxID=3133306 RepID=UPI003F5B67CC
MRAHRLDQRQRTAAPNRRPRPVDTLGKIEPDELDAIAEAVLTEEAETFSLVLPRPLIDAAAHRTEHAA